MFEFLVLPATVQDIVRVRFEEDLFRIQGIRADSLSLLMHHANLRADLQLLVFDNTKGVVTAAAQQRIDGQGFDL